MTGENDNMAMQRDLEMGLAQMEQLKAQIESLRSQIASLQSILMDYTNSLDVIKEIEGKDGKEILMPIGGSAFLKVKVMDKGTCLVDRGAGIFMDTDLEKAKELIKERMESLRSGISNLETTQQQISASYEEISQRTQELYTRQMTAGNGPEKTF